MNTVKFWYNDTGVIPTKATPDSIGYDISIPSGEEYTIPAKGFSLIDSGIVVDFSAVKEPVAMHLLPRSSLFKKTGLMLANSVGLFEPDYCGKDDTVKMMFFNTTDKDVVLKGGMRVAQFYFAKIMIPDDVEALNNKNNHNDTRGGIGSSGE